MTGGPESLFEVYSIARGGLHMCVCVCVCDSVRVTVCVYLCAIPFGVVTS